MRIETPSPASVNVRRLRESKGLTQGQLAKLVGCEQSHISKIERGDRPVSLDLAAELAHRFQRPVGDFLDERRRRILCSVITHAASEPPVLTSMTEVAKRLAWEIACRNTEVSPDEMWEQIPSFQRANYLSAARAAQTLLAPSAGNAEGWNHG